MTPRPVPRVVTPAAERADRARAVAECVLSVPGVAGLSPGARGTTHTAAATGRVDGVRVDDDGVHVALVAAAPDRRIRLADLAAAVRSAVRATTPGTDVPPVHVEVADIVTTVPAAVTEETRP